MKDKRLSLTMDSNTYYQAKRLVPQGQISKLFNNFLKEYVKKQKELELKAAYQRTAQSKKMRAEDKIWEGSIEDGIDE